MRRLIEQRHRIWWVLGTALTLVVSWVAFSLLVIQFPASDQPTTADAIIVLGQPDAEALAKADALVAQGVSNRLILSTPFGEPTACSKPPEGVEVQCFVPNPSTTRGEAQKIARLANDHGWKNIVVITWPTHLSRSRWLIERCYGETLQMVASDSPLSLGERIDENLYQTGAFAKALLQRGC